MSQEEFRSLILGVLARREAYGLEVAASLEPHLRASVGGPELTEGSVYPALRWLERHGLAAARWVEVGAGAPRRRYYCLTPKGMRVEAQQSLRKPRPYPSPTVSASQP